MVLNILFVNLVWSLPTIFPGSFLDFVLRQSEALYNVVIIVSGFRTHSGIVKEYGLPFI